MFNRFKLLGTEPFDGIPLSFLSFLAQNAERWVAGSCYDELTSAHVVTPTCLDLLELWAALISEHI